MPVKKAETVTEQLVTHIVNTRFEDLSSHAIEATKTFILDSIGVGICGSRVAEQTHLIQAMRRLDGGTSEQATVWSTGERLSVASAAMINSWQIHNQEFDCVHEPAVVHPMAVILGGLLSVAESFSSIENQPDINKPVQIDGRDFIVALNIAVDVATTIGMCATQPMRFFRPAMCGALGAAAGIAKLLDCDREQTHNALGLTYSHLSGTMQAHTEGSPSLAYQIGLNARAAVTCSFMAQHGLSGPKDFLEGPFGYLNLIEGEWDLSPFKQLGKVWQMTRVSHKPFPTGRAAQGSLDGIMQLKEKYDFSVAQIHQISITAPPLILRLVNRPMKSDMNTSYAKLCMAYIAATWLLKGRVEVTDYEPQYFSDPQTMALAEKLTMQLNDVADPNALGPQLVAIEMISGDIIQQEIFDTLGSPDRPMTLDAQHQKFAICCRSARKPISAEPIARLIKIIDEFEQLTHIRQLTALLTADKE